MGQKRINNMQERLLRLTQVEDMTGFKKSYLYREKNAGRFPEPVKIGTTSRWKESEVKAWIDSFNVTVEQEEVSAA